MKNYIFNENSTCANFTQVQKEGIREISRNFKYYNLKRMLAVGYRVNSNRATQFRTFVTSILEKYIIKGFSIGDEKLKQVSGFDKLTKKYLKENN
jgi:hypothetical protein